MSTTIREDILLNAIQTAIQVEIHKIMEEETAKAQSEVERRITEIADQRALKILSHYDIRNDQGRIIIEVKKNN